MRTTIHLGTDNEKLMRSARQSLEGKWGLAIGTFFIFSVLTGCGSLFTPPIPLVSLIVGGPLTLGAAIFSLSLARGREAKLEQLFDGFSRFSTALGAYLIMVAYIILWSLLLIVPGIIAALSYSMTFYIMADEPHLHAEEALEKSKKMMDGYKMKLFQLCLWFLLLSVLCILTLGIGFLWLIPYVHVTMAKFYDDIKDQATYVIF